MKTLVFRFDIDTHKCIKEGVPNLLKLSRKHNVKFTFFINLGQAIDRSIFLRDLFKTKNSSIKNLSTIHKLGLRECLYLSVFNPVIGEKYARQIKMISAQGHEIGIHGGKNHQTWFSKAGTWSQERIVNELHWAIRLLKTISKVEVPGFASPGWNGSKTINSVLQELGFAYVSDSHSDKPVQKIETEGSLKKVPTNIAGEPGGVGYIEHCRAKKLSDKEILDDFRKKLKKRNKLAIIYDHPHYVGTKELKTLEAIILIAKSMNYEITTIRKFLNL